ncbi:MAG: type II toxin-antitoxin system RelE/ParE family toxin [Flavobacteriales bacterium]|nr:type II toxin-antitoxin system RelE/ParE family toxin [Flavobacteriales bacterium]
MATYKVTLAKRAIKALEHISEPYYSELKKTIYALAVNPRPPGCKKLKGRTGYRVRVADYRVIYTVNDSILIIEVIDLGHRKDVYR